ncbi:MAG: DNA polymerase III subunit gamma/tau C-terminal domain-containing protein, partial [Halomonas sp.]|nr:DNA polymerase III subunit gamma/tau C-terminal domain-containing protein [Halomonas sp.]
MLGTLDHRHVLALVEALAEVDAARLLGEVAALAEQGPDFAAVLDDITGVLHRLAIAQMVPDAVDNGHGDRDALLQLAARFTAEDIQLFYQIGIQGRGDMEHAPDLRTALEMTLLRMLAFRPQGVPRPAQTPLPLRGQPGGAGEGPGGDPASGPEASRTAPSEMSPSPGAEVAPPQASEPIHSLEPGAVSAPSPEPAPATEAAPPTETAPPVEEPPNAPAGDGTPAPDPVSPSPERAPETLPESTSPAAPAPPPDETLTSAPPEPDPSREATRDPEPAQAADEAAPIAPAGRFEHADWLARFESLGLGGLTRNLAAHCVVEADDGERLTLRLDPSQEAMNAEVHVTRIREALAAAGVERRLTLEPGELPPAIETPRQQADRLAARRHAEAIEALTRDPHVQKLQQAFGARLIESTVKPADAEARG